VGNVFVKQYNQSVNNQNFCILQVSLEFSTYCMQWWCRLVRLLKEHLCSLVHQLLMQRMSLMSASSLR